jgi:hypothetical protein
MTIVTATFIAFVVAQIADAGSTILALDRKGVREANPVLRWLMDRIGLGPALFFPKLAYVALATLFMGYPGIEWVYGIIAAAFFAVAVNNARIALK